MSHYQPSVSLHQQDGGMSMTDFAARHGIAVPVLRRYIKQGRVVGARQDARSKKWTIYPPAKLVDKSGDCMTRREPAARGKLPPPAGVACAPAAGFSTGSVEVVDVGTSPHGLSAGLSLPVQETRGGSSCRPPAKPGFNAFEDGAGSGYGHAAENVYRDPETRRVLASLHEVAARQFREGLHYLRLDAHEFSQLYAALDNDRSRVRKLVGKGVLPVGLLRASDSVWQKMQAMSREGRLL